MQALEEGVIVERPLFLLFFFLFWRLEAELAHRARVPARKQARHAAPRRAVHSLPSPFFFFFFLCFFFFLPPAASPRGSAIPILTLEKREAERPRTSSYSSSPFFPPPFFSFLFFLFFLPSLVRRSESIQRVFHTSRGGLTKN